MRTIILKIETEELCDQVEAALAAAGLAAVYSHDNGPHDVYNVRPIPEYLQRAAVLRASDV